MDDWHLYVIFGLQVVESSSLVSVLFREVFNYHYISLFHLVVNGFSVIFSCNRIFFECILIQKILQNWISKNLCLPL